MLFPAQPVLQLRPYVRTYVHVKANLKEAVAFWPIPARSFTCVEFTFGNPYRIHHVNGDPQENAQPCMLIGAKTYGRIRLELEGLVETFVVLFQPTGLQQLFGLPGVEVVNAHYDADAVLGPAMRELNHRLGDAASFAERVRVADEYFTSRSRVPWLCIETDRTAQHIINRRGCVRVQELADKTGLSLRHLERKFTREIGITPKLYARIARFEAAMTIRMASPNRSWTDIAHELQYHDQMHMVHDFHLLSGESPTSLIAQMDQLAFPAIPRQT